ncbi:nucleotidyltransferase family protein [Herbaspirillum huttiense]|uniref:nucleotidyltransferase family protein n=1 Tax=Herbaspirillum huttiense TaxID=863372 RepID=UPI003878064B
MTATPRTLLLAAGFGTRLQPLTSFLPKCLVPINGRPLLDYWIQSLLDQGVTDVLINTHYLAPLVESYIEHSSWFGRVNLSHEHALLGTGGTVLANRSFFGNEPLLIAHADNLTRFDCSAFFEAHRRRPHGAALTMMLFETEEPRSCGIVEIDGRGMVQAFHEKVEHPPGNLANAAVYVMEPEVVSFIASLGMQEVDLSTQVIPHFVGRIFTFLNSDYHRDIGTISSWQLAQKDFGMPSARPENAAAWHQLLDALGPDVSRTLADLDPG